MSGRTLLNGGMAGRISLAPHLPIEELEGLYWNTKIPEERSRWHFLWLLARGLTAKLVASIARYSAHALTSCSVPEDDAPAHLQPRQVGPR
jgi:hypothetical protein